MSKDLRPELGDFSSIVCFKAVVVGMEQALGDRTAAVGLISAGRKRGQTIAQQAGLDGKGIGDPAAIARTLDAAVGQSGTKLCQVRAVTTNGSKIRVDLAETVCSAGEPQGSPRELTFTLGAVQGALETITGRKLKGKQVGSVLRGGAFDTIEFDDRV